MGQIACRKVFPIRQPFRTQRLKNSKIIFISCEGCVTEEEYFRCVQKLYNSVKTRIQIISVIEDVISTPPKKRTSEQIQLASKNRPLQLVRRIDQFKEKEDDMYQFALHPDDEFWVIADVDDHKSDLWIDEWNEALRDCREKSYGIAISNPSFEIWLLLHHDDVNDEDIKYAVTPSHSYEKTNHFRCRLRKLGVPLRDKKHIRDSHYTMHKIEEAIRRAKALHINDSDVDVNYFATTVYKILEIIISMTSQNIREDLEP